MNIVHTYVKAQDLFSFAYDSKIVTFTEDEYNRAKGMIGTTFNTFNKSMQIRSTYRILEVRQATEQDYKETGTPYFVNEPAAS